MKTYAIDDGAGNRLTAGLQEHDARDVAQRMANERGEFVYLYETGGNEETSEPVAFEPEDEPGECLTCGTQCDQEGICPLCAELERAEELVREAKAAPIESCRKCGTPLTLGDVVDGSACTDEGEGEEAGNVFVYCSEHCRETH